MSPRCRRPIRCAGFSLIEVIVFIVVLGVLLAGLMVALASPLRNSPEAGRLDLAAELAKKIAKTLADKSETLVAKVESREERIEKIVKSLKGDKRPTVSVNCNSN